jgi:hypothetical protein
MPFVILLSVIPAKPACRRGRSRMTYGVIVSDPVGDCFVTPMYIGVSRNDKIPNS